MKDPSGPESGPSIPSPRKEKTERIDFSVVTRAGIALAWKIFSDCEQWHRFVDAYGRIQWRGEPWVTGSRLQIELTEPVSALQDQLITVCDPPRYVSWINQVSGFNIEQWVMFEPHFSGGTRVSTWIQFTGGEDRIKTYDVREIVQKFVEKWYSNFARECDRMAASG